MTRFCDVKIKEIRDLNIIQEFVFYSVKNNLKIVLISTVLVRIYKKMKRSGWKIMKEKFLQKIMKKKYETLEN